MKQATIANAPTVLNVNDKAMWVLGHNAAVDALDAIPTNWELSFGNDDEEEKPEWRVHRRHGSVNDREWTLIGTGATPGAALAAALGVAIPGGSQQ